MRRAGDAERGNCLEQRPRPWDGRKGRSAGLCGAEALQSLCSATAPTSPLPRPPLLPLNPLHRAGQGQAAREAGEEGSANSSILLDNAWGMCGAHEASQLLVELWEVWVLFLCAFPGRVYPPPRLPWGSEHLHYPGPLLQQLGDIGMGQGLDSGRWVWPGHPCPYCLFLLSGAEENTRLS